MRVTSLLLPTVFLVLPLVAQDTRFTREMNPGSRLELLNINGAMTILQGKGRTLDVVVTKTVKRGSGERVRAIMEETAGTVRICTIDQDRDAGQKTCRGSQDGSGKEGKEARDEVDMRYTVTLPAGVTLATSTVNGPITAKGIARADRLNTVNGSVIFTGEAVTTISVVNGSIDATFGSTRWTGPVALQTVNGSVNVALPEDASLTVHGQTVTGSVRSDFPQITAATKYGPKSFKGMLGKGGRSLDLQTVTGSLTVVKQ